MHEPGFQFPTHNVHSVIRKTGLADTFHYRFSTPSRDMLLKTLNPDHQKEHISRETLPEARERVFNSMSFERQMYEYMQQQELNKKLDKK